jgi:hypothetical protein
LLLFGGVSRTGSPAAVPACAIGGGAAFVPSDCLLGGPQPPTLYSDTWLWDGRTWQQAPATPTGPWFNPATARMATDPQTGRVVLVVYCPGIASQGKGVSLPCPTSASVPNPATFTWDGTQWRVSSDQAPAGWTLAQGNEGLVADAPAGRLSYFTEETAPMPGAPASGVSTVSFWTASGWQDGGTLNTAPRYGSGLFAATPDQRVLFIGFDGSNWSWNGSWARLSTRTAPGYGLGAVAYDGDTNQTVFFGGESSSAATSHSLSNSTWTWDGSTWTQRGGAPGSSNASHIGASASPP